MPQNVYTMMILENLDRSFFIWCIVHMYPIDTVYLFMLYSLQNLKKGMRDNFVIEHTVAPNSSYWSG